MEQNKLHGSHSLHRKLIGTLSKKGSSSDHKVEMQWVVCIVQFIKNPVSILALSGPKLLPYSEISYLTGME